MCFYYYFKGYHSGLDAESNRSPMPPRAEAVSLLRSWFDRPGLSEPFILREPQGERIVEGPTTQYRLLEINYLAVHSELLKGERRIMAQSLERGG